MGFSGRLCRALRRGCAPHSGIESSTETWRTELAKFRITSAHLAGRVGKWFLDEPISALHPRSRKSIRFLFFRILSVRQRLRRCGAAVVENSNAPKCDDGEFAARS